MDILFYVMLVLAIGLVVANIVLSVIKKRRLNDVKKQQYKEIEEE